MSKALKIRSGMVLFFLLISRILSMYFVPLNDSTEARYGEIARIMLDTGNWVTPMQHIGEPFWAKPPLSTWLSAFSMKLFGVNELAARMPSLLLSIGILWLVWDLAKKRNGSDVALITILSLAGSLFFFLNAGTVMTDPSLIFCTTLSLIAFWHAVVIKNKIWGYVFFVGLGLGLLAKGPVAVILVGMPIFVWVLIHRRWLQLWQNLPWIKGSLLMLAIALPWYILAELRTPGFLNYFIVGENIHRFLDPGWSGDKYGFAHKAPFGMIWAYAFAGMLPWSIVGLIWLLSHAKEIPLFKARRPEACPRDPEVLFQTQDHWISYLLLCTLVPLVFFTFSSNIIYPYVFPSLPFFALLFADLAHRARLTTKGQSLLISAASISGFIFLIVAILFVFKPEWVSKSQYRMVAAYKNQKPANESKLIYWAPKTDYSAQFYSAGKAIATMNIEELRQLLSNHAENYVVINLNDIQYIQTVLGYHLTEITIIKTQNNAYGLYRSDALL